MTIVAAQYELHERWGRIRELAEKNIPEGTKARQEWDVLVPAFQADLLSMSPDPKSRIAGYRSRFYERIDRDSHPGHIIWKGMSRDRPDGVPVYNWPRHDKIIRTTCAKIMYFLETGQWPPEDRYLRKICDVDRCIAPVCHPLTTDRAGRAPSQRYDDNGNPICRDCGNIVKPHRPGQTPWCRVCNQEKNRMWRATMASRRAAESEQAPRIATFIPTLVSSPPDDEPDMRTPEQVAEDNQWKQQELGRTRTQPQPQPRVYTPEEMAVLRKQAMALFDDN